MNNRGVEAVLNNLVIAIYVFFDLVKSITNFSKRLIGLRALSNFYSNETISNRFKFSIKTTRLWI